MKTTMNKTKTKTKTNRLLDSKHVRRGVQYLIGIMAASYLVSVQAEDSDIDVSWQVSESLPYHVQEIYPTVYKEHIVVAGGLSPDIEGDWIGVSDRVVIYSLQDKQWREGPALPAPRHHPMLVVVNDRLLSFGGFTVDQFGIWHNSTDVLEFIEDTAPPQQDSFQQGIWKKIAELPVPLAETLSAVHNNQVHLVTGRSPVSQNKNSQWNDQSDVNTHLIFDLDSMRWQNGKPVPTARNSACSVTLDKTLHTIGGRTVSGGNLATHEAYHFESDTWQTLAPLPQAQGGLACAVLDGRIYAFGGEYFDNGGGVYKEVWQYSPEQDKWTSVGQMPKPRHGLGALTVDNRIYVVAGALKAGGKETSNLMSVFSVKAKADD